MNKLIARAKIKCNTCGCTLNRTKTVKIIASDKVSAIEEAKQKVADWKKSLTEKNCKICQSIIDMRQ